MTTAKRVYLLHSFVNHIIGVFSSWNSAKKFAVDHNMIDGYWMEDTEIDNPVVLLKKGTY